MRSPSSGLGLRIRKLCCVKDNTKAVQACAFLGCGLSLIGVIYYFYAVCIRMKTKPDDRRHTILYHLWFGLLFINFVYFINCCMLLVSLREGARHTMLYFLIYLLFFQVFDFVNAVYTLTLWILSLEALLELVFFVIKLCFNVPFAWFVFSEYKATFRVERKRKEKKEIAIKHKFGKETAEKLLSDNENTRSEAISTLAENLSDMDFLDEFICAMGIERLIAVVGNGTTNEDDTASALISFVKIMSMEFGTLSWEICTPQFINMLCSYVSKGNDIDRQVLKCSLDILESVISESEDFYKIVEAALPYNDVFETMRTGDYEIKEKCIAIMNIMLQHSPELVQQSISEISEHPNTLDVIKMENGSIELKEISVIEDESEQSTEKPRQQHRRSRNQFQVLRLLCYEGV
ncbi:uncharacterized protein LOC144447174 [Glandiceps talaboti]